MNYIQGFAEKLIQWYTINKRDLPWRNTVDPYKIWLSEIILQQTRVQQGLPYYQRFISAYPTIKALANAPLEEVLRLWQGLGYYSRARNMHHTANIIDQKHNGIFPSSFSEIISLKGIGKYTAAAIASFAFGHKIAVVDGNVQRVLTRIFGITDDIGNLQTQKTIDAIAQEHISSHFPGEFNQAMMEFGAVQCIPINPLCNDCIFRTVCVAFKTNQVHILPVKLKKIKVKNRYFNYIIVRNKEKIALRERIGKDIWQGLFEFLLLEENLVISVNDVLQKLRVLGINTSLFKDVSETFLHILTHQRLTVRFFLIEMEERSVLENKGFKFYSLEEVDNLPKPVLLVKYLNKLTIF